MTLQNGTAIDIASAFLRERVIFLAGAIDDSLANKVVSQILLLAADSDSDITVYINSPGGSVSAGLAVFDTIQHVPCDVRTIGIGMCASMGAFLLCSGTPSRPPEHPSPDSPAHRRSVGTGYRHRDSGPAHPRGPRTHQQNHGGEDGKLERDDLERHGARPLDVGCRSG